jgi:hypothetical protein
MVLLGGGSSTDEAPVEASAGCGASGCEAELRVRF